MARTDFSEQDRLNAEVEKLRLEAHKLEREIRRLDRPFWSQWSFWRSLLAAVAVSAAVWAAASRIT